MCIDAGLDVDSVGTEEDTDIEVCNWFNDYELFIHEKLLENLSASFKEVYSEVTGVGYARLNNSCSDVHIVDLDINTIINHGSMGHPDPTGEPGPMGVDGVVY